MLYSLRRDAASALEDALERLGHGDLPLRMEDPPEDVDAAVASAVAFQIDGDPTENAEEIAREIDDAGELVEDVAAQGPYVNFVPGERYREKTLEAASDETYPVLPDREESILLEHTSANPTGPLHVGRARNPIIGDSLARVLRKAGYTVEVEYYVNDVGRQVATITWALENVDEDSLEAVERDKADHDVVRYYRRANEILEGEHGEDRMEEAEEEIDELLQGLERGDDAAHEAVTDAVERCLDGQLESLERLNSGYDGFVRESEFVLDGSVDEVADRLEDDRRCFEEDDALALDLSGEGIDKELVFRRADGTSLYTTRDIAYHLDKFERCDRAINVLGEDHKLQACQLDAALDVIGEDRSPENIFYSYVNLPEGKMSTREGTVVDVDDLLDEAVERARNEIEKRSGDRERDVETPEETAASVGIGAVRFDIVARQPEKPITFRWEEALDFDGQHSPYVQYVHARTAGILEKADEEPEFDASTLDAPEEEALIRKIAEFSHVVDTAAEELSPHRLASYSRELAEAFNEFYRECRVLESEVEAERLALVKASKHAIAGSLDLLGVEAPESM